MNEIPLNTHSYYVTALETKVATIVLLSFWISIFVCLIQMLFFRFCWWKLYNKFYKAFCDSNAYVIKRLLVGYGNNYMYSFWCVVNIALLTSRIITPHQNTYIYFNIQPITYNYYIRTLVFLYNSIDRN